MRHTLFIRSRGTDWYYKGANGETACKRSEADLYDQPTATRIISSNTLVTLEAVEASASEYMRYIGRKGGKTITKKRCIANRKRARLPRGPRKKPETEETPAGCP